MSNNRMERGYERGYEIDYPPPPVKTGPSLVKHPTIASQPPPLPPKAMNTNLSLSCASNVTSKLGEIVSGGGTWTPGSDKSSSLLDSHDRYVYAMYTYFILNELMVAVFYLQ
jgi:hypothetical protein